MTSCKKHHAIKNKELVRKTATLFLLTSITISGLAIAKPTWAAENSWTTRAPMQTARSRLGVATVNGKIYAIGGDVVNLIGNCIGPSIGDSVNTTEEYNPDTGVWVFKKPMPTPRCNFATAVYQNKIYCIGGYLSDRTVTGINEVYDPATDTWETRAAMPTPRMGLQANTVKGKIFLIGGKTDYATYLDVNEVYDPVTDTWTTKASSTNRITSGATAVADGKIYVLATASKLDLGAFIQCYNPEENLWNIDALSPTYGDWSTTAAATSAGHTPAAIVFFSESSTYVYSPASKSWTVDALMPTARGFTGVAVVNNVFYVVGGIKAPFSGYIVITSSVATNEQYKLGNNQPVKVDSKIYIRADGSIEPSTANITTADRIYYTFTGDNSERLVIERDNIILDGKGYTLQGTDSNGIALFNRNNVMITNLTIAHFPSACIAIERSNNIIIAGNNIVKSLNNGIRTFTSSNITIAGNKIQDNRYMSGIQFEDNSNNNLVYGNDITGNYMGVFLIGSKNNQIYHNNLQNSVNAKVSDKLSNIWDNGSISGGNYWSDYCGIDSDGNGIGDTPWTINEKNKDNFPLMTPSDISSVTVELPDFTALQNPLPSSQETYPQQPSESFPTGAFAAASIAIIAGVGVVLLVYFRKRNVKPFKLASTAPPIG